MRAKHPEISGFLSKAKKTAGGGTFRGRFSCPDVQWIGEGQNTLVTFTITADELTAAAEGRLLWTDQGVQRGILPEAPPSTPRELSLADGYPDPKYYIFDAANANDIAEKLLEGERVFLNPLVWNLRPGTFEAFWNRSERAIYIYSGRIYLPDSHHRQQAIVKAVGVWRDAKTSYRRFNGSHQFKIELYFLSREDEGNYFFDKNQRPKPTAKSKAYDLTTLDDLSLLAKLVIVKSVALSDNVNRVTDRLSAKNPQVITLSTLREMMRTFAGGDALDETQMEGLAVVASSFYDLVAQARPELARLPVGDRRITRDKLIVDSATMMHGYAALMKDYNNDISEHGVRAATKLWQARLGRFAASHKYKFENWSGDLFAKNNPLWQRVGVVKPNRDGKGLTVLNTGGARAECGRVLRQLASLGHNQHNLAFLLKG